MKKIISAFLSLVMLAVLCVPVLAANFDRLESVAYMDLDVSNEEMRAEILEAREKIIFSKSWVADGICGQILDKDGNLMEELPQFSELFPANWDIPSFLGQETAMKSDIAIPRLINPAISRIDVMYENSLMLINPPASTTTPAFCSFDTTGFIGTPYEYTYKKIYTTGVFANPAYTAYYNVGYSNASTGASLGWKPDIPNASTFSIDPPSNITVAVRASTYSHVGSWGMKETATD